MLGGMKKEIMTKVADKGHQLLTAINDNLGSIQRNFKEVVGELASLKVEQKKLNDKLSLICAHLEIDIVEVDEDGEKGDEDE